MYELFTLFILMFLAIVFVISYLVADEFYDVALAKGYESRKYFWIPFWLGLPGWLLVIALPNKDTPAVNNSAPVNLNELPKL